MSLTLVRAVLGAHASNDLHSWGVSVLAQNSLAFDLNTSTDKLMCTIMAGIATLRDLISERVKSGLAAAKAKGVVLGRQAGKRPSDKKAGRVRQLHGEGLSFRLIAHLGLSKNTVMEIVRRDVAA